MDLDETSATGLLLDLLNKGHNAKISKDKEFYLGACTEDADANVQLVRKHDIGVRAWYHGSFGLTIIRIYLRRQSIALQVEILPRETCR